MQELFGYLIVAVAHIYLIALLLHLFLEPGEFYANAFLTQMNKAVEPLLAPLRRAVGSQWLAVLIASTAVLVAQAMLLWVMSCLSVIVISFSISLMSTFLRSVPVVTPIFMCFGFVADWILWFFVISSLVTNLLEPYTRNPISRFAFRVVDLGEKALGPLAPRLGAPWQTRLAVGVGAILANALTHMVLIGLLKLFSGAGLEPASTISVSLASALYLAISWGFQFFIITLFIAVIMSWFSPDPRNPLVQFISAISFPMFAPFRRYIPPIAGIDISPGFAIVLLVISRGILLSVLMSLFGPWV